MGQQRDKIPLGDRAEQPKPSSSPFAALQGMRDALPPGDSAPASTTSSASASPARFAQRVVVRLEKKGHGGKAVTVVQGVLVGARDEVTDALKRRLGTGARQDGGDVVVQGDVVDRVAAVLTALGATNVIIGTKR